MKFFGRIERVGMGVHVYLACLFLWEGRKIQQERDLYGFLVMEKTKMAEKWKWGGTGETKDTPNSRKIYV